MEEVAREKLKKENGTNPTDEQVNKVWQSVLESSYNAGTSIGGIVLLLLLSGWKVTELKNQFNSQLLKTVFWTATGSVGQLFSSTKYHDKYLRQELLKMLAAQKLDETSTFADIAKRYPNGAYFGVCTYRMEDNKPCFLNSFDNPEMPIIDAMLMTSAAPSYFPLHKFDNKTYCDGGIFANNPSLILLHAALDGNGDSVKTWLESNDCWLINIGTGYNYEAVDDASNRVGWLGRVISLCMNSDVIKTRLFLRTLEKSKLLKKYVECDTQLKRQISLDEQNYDILMAAFDESEKSYHKQDFSLTASIAVATMAVSTPMETTSIETTTTSIETTTPTTTSMETTTTTSIESEDNETALTFVVPTAVLALPPAMAAPALRQFHSNRRQPLKKGGPSPSSVPLLFK